jgi:hypothetical protein
MKSYLVSEEKITEKIKIDLNNKYFCYKKITIDGVEYESIISAANILNINRNTLRNRLKNGYYRNNYKEAKMSI